jgi:hypothetical protein
MAQVADRLLRRQSAQAAKARQRRGGRCRG